MTLCEVDSEHQKLFHNYIHNLYLIDILFIKIYFMP